MSLFDRKLTDYEKSVFEHIISMNFRNLDDKSQIDEKLSPALNAEVKELVILGSILKKHGYEDDYISHILNDDELRLGLIKRGRNAISEDDLLKFIILPKNKRRTKLKPIKKTQIFFPEWIRKRRPK